VTTSRSTDAVGGRGRRGVDVHDGELANRVKDVFIRVLELPLDRHELTDDMSLYSPVIQMDSLALLELLVALEEDFGIEIDDEDVMNTNFTTVASVIEMMADLLEASGRGRAEDEHPSDQPGTD